MKWISDLFSGYWRSINLASILVLCLLLIVGGPPVASVVGGAIVSSLYYPFFKVRSSVMELRGVNRENERLHKALVEASVKLTRVEEAERENLRLRAVLGFEPPEGYALLPAKVISVSGQPLPTSAVINRGSRDQVAVGQSLVNEEGLIGRVVAVFHDVATIQLLTDPGHRTSVRVASSREMGIARYRTIEGMVLDNLPIQAGITEGDTIITSGVGGVYPPGLVVGLVKAVQRPQEESFCEVQLTPAVNFTALEELFVLKESIE